MIKRYLVVGIVLLFVFMSFAPSTAVDNIKKTSTPVSNGNILYVGGSGEGNYTNINDAINDAVDRDTIYVFYGVYHENITINKELTLIGIENQEGQIPLLDKNDNVVIVIIKDNCTIQNFEIRTEEDAILLNSDNNLISNCIVSNAVKDLNIKSSSNNKILNNEFRGGWIGIRCVDSNYNLIQNNNVHDHVNGELNFYSGCNNNLVYNNNFSYSRGTAGIQNKGDSSNNAFYDNVIKDNKGGGIEFRSGVNLTFVGNQLINNSFTFYYNSISLSQFTTSVFVNNTINSNPIYFYVNQSDLVIPTDAEQVFLIQCRNSNISDLNINYADYPILLYSCSFINISRNYLSSGNSYGIFIKSSDNITVTKNIISKFSDSIVFYDSYDNIISENNIDGGSDGIELRTSCFRNLISKNDVSNKSVGIDIYNSGKENTISKNNIKHCSQNGIYSLCLDVKIIDNYIESCCEGIIAGTFFCLIQNNTVTKCSELGIGISGIKNIIEGNTINISGTGIKIINGFMNVIKNNNFIWNFRQAYFENALLTKWKRNYWSNNVLPPKIIKGKFHFVIDDFKPIEIEFPWINVDLNPRLLPYNIPTGV